MNPLTRFCGRATEYAKYRPNYPNEAIALILAELGNPDTLVAADIGAGTGISSRLLADFGVRVLAIEPNFEMRQAATADSRIEWREGTAEKTHLSPQSVDLVTAFQAFHWFNPEPCFAEFHRILKPSGRLAIVWNHRNREDGFTQEYSAILKQASKYHPAENEKRRSAMDSLYESSYFQNIHYRAIPHQQALDLSGLIGRTHSASYIPTEGSEAEAILSKLERLYQKWKDSAGLVYLIYRTDVYVAEINLNL